MGGSPAGARPNRFACTTRWWATFWKKREENWASRAERRVLLGFSQPVSLNYRFAEAHPDAVRGVVGICGGLPGDWDDEHPGRIGAAVLHIARGQDEFYPAERTEQYARRLRLRCDDVEFHLLEGGHTFPSRGGPVWESWLNRGDLVADNTDKIMASGKFFRRPAVMLALALCSVGGLVTLMGQLATGPQVAQKRVQLSAGEASEAYPSISPDGKRVAYSARESSKVSAFHVFVRELPSGKPQQLTKGEGSDVAPVWSPDGGSLAFLRVEDGNTQCIVIPADGGTERKVAELGPAANSGQPMPAVSWNPDGKSLVVVQSGEKQRPDSRWSRWIRASCSASPIRPKAAKATLARSSRRPAAASPLCGTRRTTAPIFSFATQRVARVRRLTFDDRGIRGIAWTRDGQDLLYSGNRVGGWRLWRVPVYGGSPRDLIISGKQAYYPAIGRNRMAYTDSPDGVVHLARHARTGDTVEERPVFAPPGAR